MSYRRPETPEQIALAERINTASHAVQSAVALRQSLGAADGEPKHLRTGINLAMVESYTIIELLLDKGIITYEEYLTKLAEATESEVAFLEGNIQARFGGMTSINFK